MTRKIFISTATLLAAIFSVSAYSGPEKLIPEPVEYTTEEGVYTDIQDAYQALREGDIPFVMGYNMFLAILTVIGTLLSDIMYSVVDPRVKLGK